MVEFGKLLGQAGGKQMYSQSVCRCAVAALSLATGKVLREWWRNDVDRKLCVCRSEAAGRCAGRRWARSRGGALQRSETLYFAPKPVDFGTRDEMGVLGVFDGSSQATGDVAREEGVGETALTRQRPAGRHVGHSELRPARR